MKFKIIVDSSSNLVSTSYQDKEIGFSVVPLTLRIDGKDYVDNDDINVNEMLDNLNKCTDCKTSCPSPQAYLNELDEAEYNFIVTITSKLSGSFNSACVARNMAKDPNKVFVLDSKGTAGSLILLVEKLFSLIKEGKEYEEIVQEITKARDEINLLFVLDKFDNLVRNGRINKAIAFIASKISIKPLCYADDGEIKVKEQIRTLRGVSHRLVHNIGKMCAETKNKICVICHTKNLEFAKLIKELIEQDYQFKEVRILDNRGLCSFYSLEGGIIVTF